MKVLDEFKMPPWLTIECDWSDWDFTLRHYKCEFNYDVLNLTKPDAYVEDEGASLVIRKMGSLYIGPLLILYGNGEQRRIAKENVGEIV